MQYKSSIVAIIDIEVGKSILFILLISISSGVTIVVMLLVVLRFDIKERCN
jgi:superfamily II DNA helicase RecQ